MFYKARALRSIENFLHRYEVRHDVSKCSKEVVHTYTFLAKGKQLPILVTVKERHERGLFWPRTIVYECKSHNTLHTQRFTSVDKMICHLLAMQDKKDRADKK